MCYDYIMKYVNYFLLKKTLATLPQGDEPLSPLTFKSLADIKAWCEKDVFIADHSLWISENLAQLLCNKEDVVAKLAVLPVISDTAVTLIGDTAQQRLDVLTHTLGYYVPHIVKFALIKRGNKWVDIKDQLHMKKMHEIASKQGVRFGFGSDQGAVCFPLSVFDEALGGCLLGDIPETNTDSIKTWGKNIGLSEFFEQLNKHRHNGEAQEKKEKKRKEKSNSHLSKEDRIAQIAARLDHLFKQKNVLCIDIEMYEDDHGKVLEIGLTDLKDKSGMDTVHYIVSEHLHLNNGRYVPDHRDDFMFGTSRILSEKQIAEHLMASLKASSILIAHGIGGDVNVLSRFFREQGRETEFTALLSSLECVDSCRFTKLLCQRVKSEHSVKRALKELSIPFDNLHNAGNDAAYTVQLLHGLHIKHCTELSKRPKKTPKT